MNGSLRWRMILTLVVAVVAIAFVLPSFPTLHTSGLEKVLPESEINLGLDLKGGIHLTLGVDVDKAILNSVAQMGQDVRAEAREEGVLVLRPKVNDAGNLTFVLLKTYCTRGSPISRRTARPSRTTARFCTPWDSSPNTGPSWKK